MNSPLGSQIGNYLSSPKVFNLEMPLYTGFDLTIPEIAKRVHELISDHGIIDAFCIWCNDESIFQATQYNTLSFDDWIKWGSGLQEMGYKCSRKPFHAYYTYYFRISSQFYKIGQFPSVADFQIPQAKKYRKVLGESLYKEYTRGIGLAASGV